MPASTPLRPVVAGLALAAAFAVPAAIAQQTSQPARQRDVITREEIERAQLKDAYQVVLRLRPEFLQRADRPQPSASASDDDPGNGSTTFGRGTVVGSYAPAGRTTNPYSPEFDRGRPAARRARAKAPREALLAQLGLNRTG
jgi:hypothetical protein